MTIVNDNLLLKIVYDDSFFKNNPIKTIADYFLFFIIIIHFLKIRKEWVVFKNDSFSEKDTIVFENDRKTKQKSNLLKIVFKKRLTTLPAVKSSAT